MSVSIFEHGFPHILRVGISRANELDCFGGRSLDLLDHRGNAAPVLTLVCLRGIEKLTQIFLQLIQNLVTPELLVDTQRSF